MTDSTFIERIRRPWRVVDIVVASVLGVATGLVFVVWNISHEVVSTPLTALLPGLQGVGHSVWLVGGLITALVIRKPGAAIYGEMVAAIVSTLVGGNEWGYWVLVSGFTQGLGAELVFLLFAYANWRLGVALLAGAGAGLAMAVTDLVLWYVGADTAFAVIYTISSVAGGAAIAGVLSWLAVRGLAATGVLSRFPSGRDATARV